ncbi:MAG: flavin reductase family protein [Armatimonadota bacterium]|jgi:flavin reductase (DIM6/NTAB) family NADH-FMN oxidoreductase RutF
MMAKTQVGPNEYLRETVEGLSHPGLLLVSLDGKKRPNAMTIGWGSIGIYWGKPIFVVPVRPSRYTYQCIEKTGDFTVNLLPRKLVDVATFCGTVSGRDHDKLTEARLTAAASQRVKSPIIEECVLHYECRVAHVNDVLSKTLVKELNRSAYPRGDYHRLYFGEIVNVTAEEALRRRL